jgi:predicted transcriptional regulator
MGQSEVWSFILKHPNEWFNSYDIEKALNIKRFNISKALSTLRRYGEVYRVVKRELLPNGKNQIKYRVRYYKVVPKNKFITYDAIEDALNNIKHSTFEH